MRLCWNTEERERGALCWRPYATAILSIILGDVVSRRTGWVWGEPYGRPVNQYNKGKHILDGQQQLEVEEENDGRRGEREREKEEEEDEEK